MGALGNSVAFGKAASETMVENLMEDTGPIYARVCDELMKQISGLEHGTRLPSDRELSEKFNVDRSAVRKAMQILEEEGYVVRHHGKGTFIVKTEPEASEKSSADIVGLIIPDVEIPNWAKMLKGAEEEAAKHGYGLVICNALLNSDREKTFLDYLSHQSLAGIILAPMPANSLIPEYAKLLQKIKDNGTRIVLADQYIPELDIPAAMIDKIRVGYIATEHLIMRGHSRIAYACSASYDNCGMDAFRGYKMALKDYDIEFCRDLVFDIDSHCCLQPTHDAVVEALSRNPKAFTAIATPAFSMTHGIIKAVDKLGMRIPDDIALVGGDVSQSPGNEHVTQILQPLRQVGVECMKLLLRDEENETLKRYTLIKPQLVIGTSCGASKI